MKQTITWHQECLDNWRSSNERLRAEIETKQRVYQTAAAEILFYEHQITAAMKEQRTGFDRERYRVTRRASK